MPRNYVRKTKDTYSYIKLIKAIIAVGHGQPKKEAAKAHRIPISTLSRKIRAIGNNQRSLRGNPKSKILSDKDEAALVQFLKKQKEKGWPLTCRDIRHVCYQYCRQNGIQTKFNKKRGAASYDWYYGFVKRHNEVTAVIEESHIWNKISGTTKPKKMVRNVSKTKTKNTKDRISGRLRLKPTKPAPCSLLHQSIPRRSSAVTIQKKRQQARKQLLRESSSDSSTDNDRRLMELNEINKTQFESQYEDRLRNPVVQGLNTRVIDGRRTLTTMRCFSKHEFLIEINGEILTQVDGERRRLYVSEDDKMRILNLGEDYNYSWCDLQSARNLSRYILHGDNENCVYLIKCIDGSVRVFMVCSADINADEPIVFNFKESEKLFDA